MTTSLLHSRFKCRHMTLLPGALRDDTKNSCVGGALCDDTKNGCVADYMILLDLLCKH